MNNEQDVSHTCQPLDLKKRDDFEMKTGRPLGVLAQKEFHSLS